MCQVIFLNFDELKNSIKVTKNEKDFELSNHHKEKIIRCNFFNYRRNFELFSGKHKKNKERERKGKRESKGKI